MYASGHGRRSGHSSRSCATPLCEPPGWAEGDAYLTEAPLAEELRNSERNPLEVSDEEFASRIRGRRARIKALLLDQSVLRASAISMRMKVCGERRSIQRGWEHN